MEKYIYDESNGLWYELRRDYYIPCLVLPAEKENKPIGLWGQRHLHYLKEHKRLVYLDLLASSKLNEYLVSVDEQAENMFSWLVKEYADKHGMTEKLKTEKQLREDVQEFLGHSDVSTTMNIYAHATRGEADFRKALE